MCNMCIDLGTTRSETEDVMARAKRRARLLNKSASDATANPVLECTVGKDYEIEILGEDEDGERRVRIEGFMRTRDIEED